MTRFSRAHRAAPLIGLALLLPVLPTTAATSVASQRASIDVSPNSYVGGQYITLHGNIGRDGVRTVKLQGTMGRPGDRWERIATQRTDGNGHFEFSMPAPSMFGIQRRVVAKGGLSSGNIHLKAKSQDLVVTPVGTPVAGRAFALAVDTTPALRGRPDLPPPVLPNRTLTLQRRDGTGWTTLDTTKTDSNGNGRFSVTVHNRGAADFRVRQENYFTGYHEIGWFPSFPTRVRVRAPGSRLATRPAAARTETADAGSLDVAAMLAPFAKGSSPATPASAAYGWNPALFDFGWEHGESLTSPPQRGTDLRGWWVDGSAGYGRASKHNGGMMLDSKRQNSNGRGDRGRTWVTMHGNPRTYGRWEVRVRIKTHENNARDYRTKVQLVPDSRGAYNCGGRTITIADLNAHSRSMRFGAKAMSKRWTGAKGTGGVVNNRSLVFAVDRSPRSASPGSSAAGSSAPSRAGLPAPTFR